jgi:hypothetical protein
VRASPLLGLVLVLLASAPARAGPVEARARWREAAAVRKTAPWRDRLVAYRSVRTEAGGSDPIGPRALAAEAKILREAGHAHGAAASEAAAAAIGPRRDEDRVHAALEAGRALLADGDLVGARAHLRDVVENGGAATPASTGPALETLARIAREGRDGAGLERLAARARDDVPAAAGVRLAILDLLGLERLDGGDASGARRAHAEQRRVYEDAVRSGGTTGREAAKAWLDLDLPKRLAER